MSYTVKSGDTLSQIANANGVSLAELEALNPDLFAQQYIHPGDTVLLPGDDGVEGSSSSGDSPSITVNSIGGQELNQIPGTPEVWKVGDTYYLTFFVPGTDPPVPMTWSVPDTETLQAFFGPGQAIKVDRTMDEAAYTGSGAINFGTTNEIPPGDGDPFENFLEVYELEAQIRPWLLDPEILSLMTMAAVEGRTLTDAELQTTEWWRTHSEEERKWLSLNAGDPSTAERLIEDNRRLIASQLEDSGISAPEELVNQLADNYTTGTWTQSYLLNQIEALAMGGELDESITDLSTEITQNAVGIEEVREIVQRWLGPAGAKGWTEATYQEWARKLQFNATGEDDLIALLRNQRQVFLPGYDSNLDYESIASTWRGRFASAWGGLPDESSNFWVEALKLNDVAKFDALLRKEGVKQGNATVAQSLITDLGTSFGDNVRKDLV